MEENEMSAEVLRKGFSALTEGNRRKVIDMTKFLILTQNAVVPGILAEKNNGLYKENYDENVLCFDGCFGKNH